MDQAILKSGGIDYEKGVARFMGDAMLYERVLRAFAKDNVAQRARIAYDNRDIDGLHAAVHEAKGTSGNMELHEAYRLACAIVALIRSNEYTYEEISELFLKFERSYLLAQECVRKAAEE